MKKILLLTICTSLLFSLISCGTESGTEHTHDFSCRITSEEFLAEEANCQFPASYYFSCECGEIDTENLFPYGDPVAHNFSGGTCLVCGEDDPDFNPDEDGPIELPIIPFE